jgi:predicted nucleic acid-binding Zn finger protein
MVVLFGERGPVYDIQSESGNTYEVDVEKGRCSCPDWQKRGHLLGTKGCKHLRRTNLEIVTGQVPQPNGTFFR